MVHFPWYMTVVIWFSIKASLHTCEVIVFYRVLLRALFPSARFSQRKHPAPGTLDHHFYTAGVSQTNRKPIRWNGAWPSLVLNKQASDVGAARGCLCYDILSTLSRCGKNFQEVLGKQRKPSELDCALLHHIVTSGQGRVRPQFGKYSPQKLHQVVFTPVIFRRDVGQRQMLRPASPEYTASNNNIQEKGCLSSKS